MSISCANRLGERSRPEWAEPIACELEMVERTLESVVCSDISTAFDISMHLLSAGGKRIRPALVVLSGIVGGECDPERLTCLAAAAELVHMASLVHDDVIDETSQRRGVVTAAESYGNKISVLGGDYLLAKAMGLLAAHGTPDILRSLSSNAVRMTESEILQASAEGDLAAWEANYWRIIRDKTAGFMAACCECGALLAGAEPHVRDRLCEYGVQLGLAFQITDDVLDISGNCELTGKETGTDLMHGKFTLPVLLAVRADESGELREILASGKLTRSQAEDVAARITRSGVLANARLAALDRSEEAIKQIRDLPRSRYTDALIALARFVISREA